MDDYSKTYLHRSRHRTARKDDYGRDHVDNQLAYPPYPVSGPPYGPQHSDVYRHSSDESDYSAESLRREFHPPVKSSFDDHQGDLAHAEGHDASSKNYKGQQYSDIDHDNKEKKQSKHPKEESKSHRHSLSQGEIILTAVGGAALAVGGKELWHRRHSSRKQVSTSIPKTSAKVATKANTIYDRAESHPKYTKKAKEDSRTRASHPYIESDVNDDYYADEKSTPKSSRLKSRRKSTIEGVLDLTGLSGTTTNDRSKEKEMRRRRSDDSLSHQSRRKLPDGVVQLQKAAKAALIAGAAEAFRVRNEPGGWGGNKGKRVLTAALGASAIDATSKKENKFHILEAVIGGLAGNNLINGGKNQGESRSNRGRSQSKSRSRGDHGNKIGPLVALVSAGLGALANSRNHSRSRSRSGSRSRQKLNHSRRESPDSYKSRNKSPFSKRQEDKYKPKRSKSITEIARRKLSALGVGDISEYEDDRHTSRPHRLSHSESDENYNLRHHHRAKSSKNLRYSDEGYYVPRNERVGRGTTFSCSGENRSYRYQNTCRSQHASEREQRYFDSDESLGLSTDDERPTRRMKGKQILKKSPVTVATIHAVKNVYQSLEKREPRHRAVDEAILSPKKVKEKASEASVENAASLGVMEPGIKYAASEILEAFNSQLKCRECQERREWRYKKRHERLQGGYTGADDTSAYHYYQNLDSSSTPELKNERYYYSYAHGDDIYPYSSTLPAPPVGHYD